MATITTNTFLDSGVARTQSEVWALNGGVLTVRTDTRVHANAPASMTGTFGNITVSPTLGGGILIDGRNIREVWFNSGAGVVPAIGTSVTQGGVTGYLLGVWANLASAPAAVGAAMPSTGFLKFREVTGGSFAAGALGGISASATGADTSSWLEVVQSQLAINTIPRLGFYRTRGTWYELPQTTDGTASQSIQTPTNGGGAGVHVPCLWIETAPASGVYEKYPCLPISFFLTANLGTDQRSKFCYTAGNGVVRVGGDGTNTMGFIPPSGCKIRIPNILGRQAAAASGAVSLEPSATLATRPDFATTSAGEINFEYFMNDWYHNFSGAFLVRMHHCATFDTHISVNEASPTDILNCAISSYLTASNIPLSFNLNPLGGTVEDCKFARGPSTANGHTVSVSLSSNYVFNNVEAYVIQYARSSGAFALNQARSSTFNNIKLFALGVTVTTCQGITFNDLDYSDRILGNTNSTGPKDLIRLLSSSDNITFDGITIGLNGSFPETHPYTSIISSSNSSNCTIRNAGTLTSSVGGSTNATGLLYSDTGGNDGIRLQRIFLTATRTNLVSIPNFSKNIILDNCAGTTGSIVSAGLNTSMRGIRAASSSVTGQASCYGSHWFDMFESDTAGRIWLAFNEPTAFSASQYQAVSLGVGAGFTSAGNIAMPNLGDQIIFTMDYFAIGHTRFANIAPTITATNSGNFTFEYDLDTGAGFTAVYKTLNAANLFAETLDPVQGVKLKIRATVTTANAANALTYIRVSTESTLATQSAALYPLDTATITINGLRAGSRVFLYDVTNSVELFNEVVAGTSLSYSAPYADDYLLMVRVMYATAVTADEFIEFTDNVTVNGLTRSVTPVIDDIYVANLVDGFSVVGIAINDSALLIEADDGTFSWADIYAYETAWLFSEEGIRDEGRFITAVDSANYILENFKIKNVSSPTAPLVITGGWGRDSVTGQTVTLIDTTGGTIFSNPDLVVSFATGSGLSPSEQATLSKLDTLTEISDGLRFTTKALEQAPTGGGGGSGPTAEEIADAVWEEVNSDHLTAGSTGEKLNSASTGNPWEADLATNNTAGTFGAFVQKLLTVAKFLGLK